MHVETPISMTDSFHYHKGQDDLDRRMARNTMWLAGAETAYVPETGGYVAYRNADGQVVAYLWATYILVTERAKVMPPRNPLLGAPTTHNIENGRGWNVWLSNYVPGRGRKPGARNNGKGKVGKGGKARVAAVVTPTVRVAPPAVFLPASHACLECDTAIPMYASRCATHQAALTALVMGG